jgi:hypothetical protein
MFLFSNAITISNYCYNIFRIEEADNPATMDDNNNTIEADVDIAENR